MGSLTVIVIAYLFAVLCLSSASCKFLNNLEGFVEGQGAPWNLVSLKDRRGSLGTTGGAGGSASASGHRGGAATAPPPASASTAAATAKANVILDIEELAALGKEAEVSWHDDVPSYLSAGCRECLPIFRGRYARITYPARTRF